MQRNDKWRQNNESQIGLSKVDIEEIVKTYPGVCFD